MNNKSCEIELKFNNWQAEDIILKLAEYIDDGFRICSCSTNYCCRDKEVTINLTQYGGK